MNEHVTYSSMMRVLPDVLKKAPSLLPLGQTAATFLELAAGSTELAAIYDRIDELPESLLDLLANDFGVIWYDADEDLETKRRVIKESFYVHRHLGTVGATRKALSAVWPNSGVEEWFEYNGDPYMFRVILEATSEKPVNLDDIFNIIRTYQSARSHLEDGQPVIRVTFGIVIETAQLSKPYGVLACGTVPRVATHGDMDHGGLYVGAGHRETSYRVRPCGTSLNSLM